MPFLGPPTVHRSWVYILRCVALFGLFVIPGPCLSAPATPSEVANYTGIGAMTICFLNALDIDFDKSMQATSTAMMRTLVDQHESSIAGQVLSRKPSEEELREAIVVQLTTRTVELCGDKFRGPSKKQLKRVLDLIQERYYPKKLTNHLSDPSYNA